MQLHRWMGVAALAFVASQANAQGIISNGTIKMGVTEYGSLNVNDPSGTPSVQGTTYVGLRLLTGGLEYESTSPGCLCEGWGAGIATGAGAGTTGWANEAEGGDFGLAATTFVSDATTATTTSTIGGTLKVTHEYLPSSEANLYEVKVTIENISGGTVGDDATGVVYRRNMDWDIEPTAFDEFVKLDGWPAANLWRTSNDGFASSNPLSSIGGVACAGVVANGNFESTDSCDHGALFDFKFGELLAGESVTFSTYYGAATTESALLTAMAAVGVEVYSVASCADGFDPGECPAIHGFGFKGVGGTVIGVPEPSAIALLVVGMVGLVARRRRSV